MSGWTSGGICLLLTKLLICMLIVLKRSPSDANDLLCQINDVLFAGKNCYEHKFRQAINKDSFFMNQLQCCELVYKNYVVITKKFIMTLFCSWRVICEGNLRILVINEKKKAKFLQCWYIGFTNFINASVSAESSQSGRRLWLLPKRSWPVILQIYDITIVYIFLRT